MCIGTFSIHTNEAASERFNHSFHFHANIDRLWANCCSPQVHGVSLQVASGFRLLQIVDMLHTLLHRMWMVQKKPPIDWIVYLVAPNTFVLLPCFRLTRHGCAHFCFALSQLVCFYGYVNSHNILLLLYYIYWYWYLYGELFVFSLVTHTISPTWFIPCTTFGLGEMNIFPMEVGRFLQIFIQNSIVIVFI